MIAISGGSIISVKKRLIDLGWSILTGIVEKIVEEAFDCFQESFEPY
jgi:hypothetical protein